MRIIGRHRWVLDALITESIQGDKVRFTATIHGWQGFLIYEGKYYEGLSQDIAETVRDIRDRIEAGDESVFWISMPVIKGRH